VRNGSVVVVANLGATPVALPADAEVLLASGLPGDAPVGAELPGDTTVWLRAR
jgi:alpha-glucosidase